MVRKHKPRSGSIAFYPRKRAKREMPRFKTFPATGEEAKPLNFYGYKAGMTHIIGKNIHKKSPSFGQDYSMAVTVIEAPPLIVLGAKAYSKSPYGMKTVSEFIENSATKELSRKIKGLGGKKKEKDKEGKEGKEKNDKEKIENLVKEGKIDEIRLIACTQPKLTGLGKKKPEIAELFLSGSVEKQWEYAKSKLGQQLSVKDTFSEKEWVDIKGVTKGKGFQGVVKRFGVKVHRPKAKERRVVGSIGPWHPATVMWTVARPGQAGYHSRTEYNKKILQLGEEALNPKGGWKNYGKIKNDYVMVEGSIPGPAKRCIVLRKSIRPVRNEIHQIEEVDYIAAKA